MKKMAKAEGKDFLFTIPARILKGRGAVGDIVCVNYTAFIFPNEENPINPGIEIDTENPISVKVQFEKGGNTAFVEWENGNIGPRVRPTYGQIISATITGTIVEVEPSKDPDNETWIIAGRCRFSI